MQNFYFNLGDDPEFKLLLSKNECDKIYETKHLERTPSYVKKITKYSIISYMKEFLPYSLYPTLGLFRSVIVNSANTVVCFSPPKSVTADSFIQSNPHVYDSHIVVEEFVEGTMINVFFDPSIGVTGAWEIATKKSVGANKTFFLKKNGKTFREMFMEAAEKQGLEIQNLNKQYCYSFVLQHPSNRIVVPFKESALYLVEVYEIFHVRNSIYVCPVEPDTLLTTVLYPKQYTEHNSYTSLIDTFASMNTPYNVMGIVIKNKLTGQRCKIRNPNYEQVKELRGNQPKLQYQYLTLRKLGKVKDHLMYYPENRHDFSSFRDHLHLCTDTLFENYIACFIKKVKKLNEYPEEYRPHMFRLHKKYLDEMRQKGDFISRGTVIDYVNNLHPSQQMFWMNYSMVKRRVDFLAVDV